MTFLYFAYGSNMLPARLEKRCPSSRAIRLGTANGFSLNFHKPSDDGSGKATLEEWAGGSTPGVLFEIESSELGSLDRAEGAGKGYVRIDDFTVDISDSNRVPATCYLADSFDAELAPYDWYLALIIAAALHYQLDQHAAVLRSVRYSKDPVPLRNRRLEALEVLRVAGHTDYETLFG